MMRQVWVSDTWTRKSNLLRDFLTFAAANPRRDLGFQICKFIQGLPDLRPVTRRSYASSLGALASQFGMEVKAVSLYTRGLSAGGACLPERQAHPATRQDVLRLIRSFPDVAMKCALFLAWKTAARWGDMLGLTRASFLVLRPDEIIIAWGVTKTRRFGEAKSSMYTVVHEAASMEWMVRVINSLPDSTSSLVTMTTSALDQRMAVLFVNPKLSAHSIKRGAITALYTALNQGRIPVPRSEGRSMISRLAKHALSNEDIAPATLSYGEAIVTARAIQSELLTRCL